MAFSCIYCPIPSSTQVSHLRTGFFSMQPSRLHQNSITSLASWTPQSAHRGMPPQFIEHFAVARRFQPACNVFPSALVRADAPAAVVGRTGSSTAVGVGTRATAAIGGRAAGPPAHPVGGTGAPAVVPVVVAVASIAVVAVVQGVRPIPPQPPVPEWRLDLFFWPFLCACVRKSGVKRDTQTTNDSKFCKNGEHQVLLDPLLTLSGR